ncbi:MAG: IclR family transcriptional regulator [Variovorax sp.]
MPRKARFDSLADDQASHQGVAAVDRALTLVTAFRRGDTALTLSELAERTRLYKSTVLRLLASLMHAKLVQRFDDGRYGLGPEVARLHAVYTASFSIDRVVMPVLRDLVGTTGESAAYHVPQGDARLCLYRVDSPHPIRDHIKAGDLLPMNRGAGGRVLMAFTQQLPKGLGAADKNLLARIRSDGFFCGVGDRASGVGGISAPVFNGDGVLVGAVTLTMPAHRHDEGHAKPVLEAARRIGELI